MDFHDIARRAKVSTATVSRTVNGLPSVRPRLAKRVWQAIEELGYSPNTQARSLVSGKSRIFGVVVSGISHPFYGSILEAFQLLASDNNYDVILGTTGGEPLRLRPVIRRMLSRRVDGIAVLGTEAAPEILAELANAPVPFIVDNPAAPAPAKGIKIDYLHGMRQAVQHLAALRHNRIAFVAGPASSSSAIERRKAFEASMNEIRLAVEPRMLLAGQHSVDSGRDAIARLAQYSEPATAVICSSDLIALGVLQEANKRRINVPRNLSVIGVQDTWNSQFALPALTTIQVSPRKVADCLFSSLYQDVEGRPCSSRSDGRELTSELVLRATTAIAQVVRRPLAPKTAVRSSRVFGRVRIKS